MLGYLLPPSIAGAPPVFVPNPVPFVDEPEPIARAAPETEEAPAVAAALPPTEEEAPPVAAAPPETEEEAPPPPEDLAATAAPPAAAAEEEPLPPEDAAWAGWTGCVCGGGYYGEMVACDGGCDNWFHFGCVGLTRLPRGEYICDGCKAAPKQKKRPAEAAAASAPKKPKERPEATKTERRDRADLEALVERARPLRFDGAGALLEAGDGEASRPCRGAGRLDLAPDVFEPLQRLHGAVVGALRRGKLLQSWEGKGKDVRSRGFAFLPASLAKWGRERLERAGLSFHAAEKSGPDAADDERANWKSCFTLLERDVDDAARDALRRLVPLVQAVVDAKYRKFVTLENLVAIQPNLHNGAAHLPPHLDFPLHDGFGVVIVTLQVAGPPAAVALVRGDKHADFESNGAPEARERCWTLRLQTGDAYVLSEDARNFCDHGVLCLPPDGRRSARGPAAAPESRESLNLRFGLHSQHKGAQLSAYREVYHQFDLDYKPPKAPKAPKPRTAPSRASSRLAK